jgi:tetratricopeptide (TPR) repeat protein
MKINRLNKTACVFLFICMVACSVNLEKRKKQGEASRNLGEVYMAEGNYTAALRELIKAEKLYPDDPFLQNDLGLAYMAKEKLGVAIGHFKKALALKPDYTAAKNNMGTAYLAKKDWDTAIACFKEVSEDILYSTPHYAQLNLGLAYYQKKEYTLAEKYFNDCLNYYRDGFQKDSVYTRALYNLSRIYVSTGRVSEAVASLEKAVMNAPRSAELYFNLAKAYTLSRDYKKGRQAYNRVIELAPESSLAREAEKEAALLKKSMQK